MDFCCALLHFIKYVGYNTTLKMSLQTFRVAIDAAIRILLLVNEELIIFLVLINAHKFNDNPNYCYQSVPTKVGYVSYNLHCLSLVRLSVPKVLLFLVAAFHC